MTFDPWAALGIPPTDDPRFIRRAYANRLKAEHLEDDPEGFAELRAAYEFALGSRIATPEHSPNPPLAVDFAPSIEARAHSTESIEESKVQPLLARLVSLASLVDPPPRQDAEALFAELIGLSAMTSLVVYTRVECEVARLILDALPRSDWLIEPVIDSFRWTRETIGDANPDLERVLQRAQDLRFWRSQANPAFGRHRARRELLTACSNRMRRFRALIVPNLVGEVRVLLDLIEFEHHSLLVTIDPGAARWWRDFLGQPRLAGWMVALTMGAPAVGFAVARVFTKEPSSARIFFYSVGAVIATVLAFSFWFKIAIPLRRIWRAHRGLRAGAVERWGWLPASLLLTVAAEAAPGWVGWPLTTMVAVALSIWCGVTIEFRLARRPPQLNFFFFFLALYGPFAGWCALLVANVHALRTPSIVLSASTTMVLNMTALFPLMQSFLSRSARIWRRMILIVAAALFGLAYVLLRSDSLSMCDADLSVLAFAAFLVIMPLTITNSVSRVVISLASNLAFFAGLGFSDVMEHPIRTIATWIIVGSALALVATVLTPDSFLKKRRT